MEYEFIDLRETLVRSELLKQQYKSDINRLKSTIEASELLLNNFDHGQKCPVCQNSIDQKCDDAFIEQLILSSKGEIQKINSLLIELEKAILILESEKTDLNGEIVKLTYILASIGEKLDLEMESGLTKLSNKLNGLYYTKNNLKQVQFIQDKADDLLKQRNTLNDLIKIAKISFETPLRTSLMQPLCDSIKDALNACRYPNSNSVVFSESNNDLVIGNNER